LGLESKRIQKDKGNTLRIIIVLVVLVGFNADASQVLPELDKLLNGFHRAAAESNFDDYFQRFAEDAYFLGTDATERWSVSEFKNYARPAFEQGRGWRYDVLTRNIEHKQGLDIYWFDEILYNEKLGRCRGTGIIVLEAGDWKIAHYSLSMLIPNEIAVAVANETKLKDAGIP